MDQSIYIHPILQEPLHFALWITKDQYLLVLDSEGSDYSAQMYRLLRVFAWCISVKRYTPIAQLKCKEKVGLFVEINLKTLSLIKAFIGHSSLSLSWTIFKAETDDSFQTKWMYKMLCIIAGQFVNRIIPVWSGSQQAKFLLFFWEQKFWGNNSQLEGAAVWIMWASLYRIPYLTEDHFCVSGFKNATQPLYNTLAWINSRNWVVLKIIQTLYRKMIVNIKKFYIVYKTKKQDIHQISKIEFWDPYGKTSFLDMNKIFCPITWQNSSPWITTNGTLHTQRCSLGKMRRIVLVWWKFIAVCNHFANFSRTVLF